MRFADIPGHNEIKQHLLQMASACRLPHALLLSGPEGTGKLSLARALAQYLQCPHRTASDSCGHCPSCVQHQSLNHADMHYVFPVVKKKSEHLEVSADYMDRWREFTQGSAYASWQRWLDTIGAGNSRPQIYVEEAANILRVANMSNYSSPVKIVLIWLPEKMNPEAANKLLKIIEEPWEDTCFIMVSNEPGRILPTIYSRTQRVTVPGLTASEIATLLMRDYSIDAQSAADLARVADGNACAAIEAIDSRGETAEMASIFREVMRKAYSRDVKGLRELADKCADMGREKNCRLLEYFLTQVRENFIYNLAMPQLSRMTTDEENFSRRFSPFINAANVEEIVSDFDMAIQHIARNANARIVMFDTFLRLIVSLIKKPQ
ncbi:MAG: AAA family ATPase [Bacteroidales bacterium]|nr:AAA family ATPase [Bacteroidales bacterium]